MAYEYPKQSTGPQDQNVVSQSLSVPRFFVWHIASTPGSPATVRDEVSERLVQARYELKVGDKLTTNGSRIEIRDEQGMILRLGKDAEVELIFDENAKRYVLSWFGEVFKMRLSNGQQFQLNLCGKYRTSCWMCNMSVFAQNIDTSRDAFYALFGKVPIFEYDELSAEFPIVEVPEGYKAILAHDDSQPMRQRYATESVVPITPKEYDYITRHYLNPNRWRG